MSITAAGCSSNFGVFVRVLSFNFEMQAGVDARKEGVVDA